MDRRKSFGIKWPFPRFHRSATAGQINWLAVRNAELFRCRPQRFQNPAIANRAFAGATSTDAAQFGSKAFQVSNSSLDVPNVVQCNAVDLGAVLRSAGQVQKIANLIEREPEGPAPSGKSQPVQVFLAVSPVISLRARRRRHKSNLFVVADRHNLHPALLGEVSDTQPLA